MKRLTLALATAFAAGLFVPLPAAAQIGADPVACPSQQDLEQFVSSNGDIQPEDCTVIDISKLTSEGQELCLIDFGVDEGFLGRLREVAMPSQWWVRCEDLELALE
ncbi:hypothetical protein [uncultured Devosia sp.]|uniref:hypothetical protein n=1 Tax=uncultured Devosia sp. TaxID=211434 RepID=UPI002612E1D2|nr:hypothetical protein [uncultured Devosia sp.]